MSEPKSERVRLLDREFEKEQEAQRRAAARIRQKAARLVRKLATRGSGKPTREARRHAAADERLFRAIKASVRAGEQVYLTGRSGSLVEDFRKQKNRKPMPAKTLRSDVRRRYWCPHWDHASDRLKALAWSKVTHDGLAYAMSVNLGNDVIASIRAEGPGFARHLLERVTRHLRTRLKALGVETPKLFFWVETALDVPPHIHGAIIILHNRPDVLDEAKRALEAAGGDRRSGHNQVNLKPMHDGPGWITYITKWELGTRIRLGDDNIAAATMGMRQAARRWYEEARTGVAPIN